MRLVSLVSRLHVLLLTFEPSAFPDNNVDAYTVPDTDSL